MTSELAGPVVFDKGSLLTGDCHPTVAASRPPRFWPEAANDTGAADFARCLALMLDEVGYGLVLLDGDHMVRLVNQAARSELAEPHPLQVTDSRLQTRSRADAAPLQEALQAAAARGTRDLLLLGEGDARVSVTVLPLGPAALDGGPAIMLLLGRRRVCDHLSVQFFARTRGLTPTETRVLELLCGGVPPARIAELQGVRISTIRTQIGGIRVKTGARSIRGVVDMVALLPPMVPVLWPVGGALPAERVESR